MESPTCFPRGIMSQHNSRTMRILLTHLPHVRENSMRFVRLSAEIHLRLCQIRETISMAMDIHTRARGNSPAPDARAVAPRPLHACDCWARLAFCFASPENRQTCSMLTRDCLPTPWHCSRIDQIVLRNFRKAAMGCSDGSDQAADGRTSSRRTRDGHGQARHFMPIEATAGA